MPQRTIIHIDMNAFFASVEQSLKPELRGKPIAVIGSAKRTVITTASYEARAWGVKTGMTVYEGKKLCPSLILVVGDNRRYAETSRRIVEMMKDFTPMIEVFSIDEAFLDVTGSLRLFGGAERIAYLLKARIRETLGLTCSVGIAPNKLLAKLASEMKKPDGLTVIRQEEVSEILERVPVRDLCGVGRRTADQLALLGIRTCGDLGRFPAGLLRKKFGVTGERLMMMGRGVDESPVVPEEEAGEVKSVSHSTTLDRDITDQGDILRELLKLSEMVGRRARKYDVWGKTVSLQIRFADFDTTIARQLTLTEHTNRTDEIYRAATSILRETQLPQAVRLLGVRLSNLRYRSTELPLFPEERKKALASDAMDSVNGKYGGCRVTLGTLLEEDAASHVISPAWRPGGIRNIDVE
jgi:DNA polymerase IV